MVKEDFIRGEFHCGWRAVEMPDGFTFVNTKGYLMPHRFWWASDFDEETGVAQVEFMKQGRGCVTTDARVLPLPFDGELVDRLTEDKGVYKIRLPHNRITYRIYDSKTKKLEDSFASWSIVKCFKDGGRFVEVAKGCFRFVGNDGKFNSFLFKQWRDTSIGTLITNNGISWALIRDGKYSSEMYLLDHQDENGMYFTGRKGKVALTNDGRIVPCDFQMQYCFYKPEYTPKSSGVMLHSGNVTVYERKPSQKYHDVSLTTEEGTFLLSELGEDLKVSGAYKNSATKRIYLYGRHSGEDMTWWDLDEFGNVDKLSDVCEYSYNKDGSIVSGGKTVIYKARDIENACAKSLV